jgi:glycine/D-amino acid oxidase-like deaminating enzyme
MSSAAAWGVEPVSIVTPVEIKELVPFIDESVIVGGFYSPGVGVATLRAGTITRARQEAGARHCSPLTEVLGTTSSTGASGGTTRAATSRPRSSSSAAASGARASPGWPARRSRSHRRYTR